MWTLGHNHAHSFTYFLWLPFCYKWHLNSCKLKLKKVGKTARPFRYDLNQIPYDYTAEVRNRFKGLDMIECLMNYGWRFNDIVQETEIKTIPMEKKCKKSKIAVWGGLTNSCEKKRGEKAKAKRKDISIWMQSSKE